jgi:hypothetical protein
MFELLERVPSLGRMAIMGRRATVCATSVFCTKSISSRARLSFLEALLCGDAQARGGHARQKPGLISLLSWFPGAGKIMCLEIRGQVIKSCALKSCLSRASCPNHGILACILACSSMVTLRASLHAGSRRGGGGQVKSRAGLVPHGVVSVVSWSWHGGMHNTDLIDIMRLAHGPKCERSCPSVR